MKITAKEFYDLIKGNEELSDIFVSDKKDKKITIDEYDDYEYNEDETFDDGDDENCQQSKVDCNFCHSIDEDIKQVEEDFKPESKNKENITPIESSIQDQGYTLENGILRNKNIAFVESFIRDKGYTSENGVLKNEFGDYLGKKDLLDFLKYLGK